jgi:hypothetical protein
MWLSAQCHPDIRQSILQFEVSQTARLSFWKSSIKMNVGTHSWWDSTHRRKRNYCDKHTSDSPNHQVLTYIVDYDQTLVTMDYEY